MKRRRIAQALVAFIAALLFGVFGAGFSTLRFVFFAFTLYAWDVGWEMMQDAFANGPFTRYKFRINLHHHMGRAFLDAGIYTKEQLSNLREITDAMPGRGVIIFTWLERGLFFINTQNAFTQDLAFTMELKTFRDGIEDEFWRVNDRLELRSADTCYELVLTSSEQRNEEPRPYQYAGFVLMRFPYTMFSALQGRDGHYTRHERVRNAIRNGNTLLDYRTYEEIRDGWEYEGPYGNFRWWVV